MTKEIILIISIICSLAATKILIPILQKNKIGQPIREEGNKEHYAKAGTPTMGGLAFVTVYILLNAIFVGFGFDTLIVILSTILYGFIGFIDDYAKIKKAENLGLTERQKLVLQVLFAFVIVVVSYVVKGNLGYLLIPFFNINLNLGILVIPVLMFVFVGTTNAVNLTDGIDGLLASISIPVFFGIFMIANSRSGDISISALIFAGVLIGYLGFNSNPASIFMGDTGSMAIGGALTAMMMLMNLSLFLVIIGGIYMAEALSVMLQVASVKLRKKRIFLMSPFHHHYELKGYKEPKIVANFMIVSIILTALTVYLVG
ncbi:MAG: phospho-N-acetylmuramoyl-pentapeptide-transferase [Tissierellia bacterium]|nr:phospho-N-acetylmuramoyl-pentapeptide-transferase [Tissierellia bacterium]